IEERDTALAGAAGERMMGVRLRQTEFVLLLDRGARWPSWLSALPAADALRVNVRGHDQSWDDFLRDSLCRTGGRRSQHERSAIVLSVSSTDAARAVLAALERCAAAVRYDDISLVA